MRMTREPIDFSPAVAIGTTRVPTTFRLSDQHSCT